MAAMKGSVAALLFSAVMILGGCESPQKRDAGPFPMSDFWRELNPGEPALELVENPNEYPDFTKMLADKDLTLRALEQSIAYFKKPSSQKYYPYTRTTDGASITHARQIASLDALHRLVSTAATPQELDLAMRRDFSVYRSVGRIERDGDRRTGEVLFTAYCQLEYDGSLVRTEEFKYPLFKKPEDLVKDDEGTPLGRRMPDGSTVPYYTRREIDTQNLLAGLELVWLRTRLEVYIVHVNGSAVINLADGTKMYVGYAGKTDRPYVGLGETMVKEGKIKKEELSLQKIKQYFAANPTEADEYINRNESYVFFLQTDAGGPYGSIGCAVTPYRTIATDKSIFPRGSACAVSTQVAALRPDGTTTPAEFVAFVCDQDTGGAIRAPARCDIFVGKGKESESIAGHTQHVGRLYYFFLKAGASPQGL